MERENTFGKHPAAASIPLWCKPPCSCSCQPGMGVYVPGRASRLLEEQEPLALPAACPSVCPSPGDGLGGPVPTSRPAPPLLL